MKSALLNIFFFIALVSATTVKQCQNGLPLPLNVDIDGCETPPCEAIKGTIAVMYVHFVGTKNDIKKITTQIRATALGITVPYDLDEDLADVCKNLMYGATCPIDETEDVVYKLDFYVDPHFPDISATVRVTLNDEENEPITCFIVNMKVKKGPTNLN